MPKNGNLTAEEFAVIHFLGERGKTNKQIQEITGRSQEVVRIALSVNDFEEYGDKNKKIRDARNKRESARNNIATTNINHQIYGTNLLLEQMRMQNEHLKTISAKLAFILDEPRIQNEHLKTISEKLAFIVDELTGTKGATA